MPRTKRVTDEKFAYYFSRTKTVTNYVRTCTVKSDRNRYESETFAQAADLLIKEFGMKKA